MLYVTVTINDDGCVALDDGGSVALEQVPTWVTGEKELKSMFLGESGSLNYFRSTTFYFILFCFVFRR